MTASNIILLELPMPTPKRFIAPHLDECKEYFQSISMPASEAEAFYDYQMSKGWRVGSSPMKCWMAAMRTWKRNCEKYGGINKFQVRPKTTFELKTIMEAKERAKKSLYDKYAYESPTGIEWGRHTKEQGEYLKLKKEIRLLNDQIGGMA